MFPTQKVECSVLCWYEVKVLTSRDPPMLEVLQMDE